MVGAPLALDSPPRVGGGRSWLSSVAQFHQYSILRPTEGKREVVQACGDTEKAGRHVQVCSLIQVGLPPGDTVPGLEPSGGGVEGDAPPLPSAPFLLTATPVASKVPSSACSTRRCLSASGSPAPLPPWPPPGRTPPLPPPPSSGCPTGEPPAVPASPPTDISRRLPPRRQLTAAQPGRDPAGSLYTHTHTSRHAHTHTGRPAAEDAAGGRRSGSAAERPAVAPGRRRWVTAGGGTGVGEGGTTGPGGRGSGGARSLWHGGETRDPAQSRPAPAAAAVPRGAVAGQRHSSSGCGGTPLPPGSASAPRRRSPGPVPSWGGGIRHDHSRVGAGGGQGGLRGRQLATTADLRWQGVTGKISFSHPQFPACRRGREGGI